VRSRGCARSTRSSFAEALRTALTSVLVNIHRGNKPDSESDWRREVERGEYLAGMRETHVLSERQMVSCCGLGHPSNERQEWE